MDFESYIARERQLIAKLDKERSESNSYERRADVGNYELAEDEIRLLKAGEYVLSRSEVAADAVMAIDERLAELHRIEDEASTRNADFLRRVTEWETRFDQRYNEVLDKIAREVSNVEARTAELNALIEAADKNIRHVSDSAADNVRKISDASVAEVKASTGSSIEEVRAISHASVEEMSKISESATANIRSISESTTAEISHIAEDLKASQAEFDASVGDKLTRDKETVERIKHIMQQMNEMIKI
jgi:hypothetical protein